MQYISLDIWGCKFQLIAFYKVCKDWQENWIEDNFLLKSFKGTMYLNCVQILVVLVTTTVVIKIWSIQLKQNAKCCNGDDLYGKLQVCLNGHLQKNNIHAKS